MADTCSASGGGVAPVFQYLRIGLAVILAPVIAIFIMGFFRKNKFPVEGRTVVITGGSQGMGRGLAKLLAQKGASIVIVARDVKKLEDAVKHISAATKNPTTQRFHYISADVTQSAENIRIITEVTAWNNGNPPDIVWANAGLSVPGLFLDTSLDTMRAQMDINYWAAVYLAHATLRTWLTTPAQLPSSSTAKPPPYIFLTTSSTAAFCGVAGYTPYSPAKAALRSLHDTLRSEINLYNATPPSTTTTTTAPPHPKIELAAVFPGTILSPGHTAENKTKHAVTAVLETGDPAQTEDEVAAAAVAALEKGHRFVATQLLGSVMRAGALQGSIRDSWFVDTVLAWVVAFAWLFVAPDMEGKVRRWAETFGRPAVRRV